jgi:hypothetical protein
LVKKEPTLWKNLSVAQLQGRLLTLFTNNRLVWKGLPGTNTPAYYENLEIKDKKFYNIGHDWQGGRVLLKNIMDSYCSEHVVS